MELERPVLSVDVVCFSLDQQALQCLLVERAVDPFAGRWALPGGALRAGESLDEAAVRVLAQRTGLHGAYLEQLYTFGDPGRDPRGPSVSVAYSVLLPVQHAPTPVPGEGVRALAWTPVDRLPPLAFDHGRMVRYARQRLAQKLEWTPLAFRVLPEEFTMGDLRILHEAARGEPIHRSNFARQQVMRWGLVPVEGRRDRRTLRPAQLFRYTGSRDVPGAPE